MSTPSSPLDFLQNITDPEANRNPVLQALIRSYQDSSLKANVDPYEQVDDELQGISPGRKFLANLVRGFASGATKKPFQSLQESLVEREINKQKIAKGQQDSQLLRIQQLMGQQTSTQNTGMRVGGQVATNAATNATRERGQDLVNERILGGQEAQQEQFAQTFELKKGDQEERIRHNQATEAQGNETNALRKQSLEALDVHRKATRVAQAKGERNYGPEVGDPFFDAAFNTFIPKGTKDEREALGAEWQKLAKQYEDVQALPEGQRAQPLARLKSRTRSVLTQKLFEDNAGDTAPLHSAQTVLTALDNVTSIMKEMKAAGLDTGFVIGKTEDTFRWLGKTQDPRYAKFEAVMRRAVMAYRQQITGAAFNNIEAREFDQLHPDIMNSFTLNETLADAAERITTQIYRNRALAKLGETADSVFSIQDETGQKLFMVGDKFYRYEM